MGCYLQDEYAVNHGSSSTAVFSGGNFDHTGACDAWLYPNGVPAGIFDDQFEQQTYAIATHAMEQGPSKDQMDKHNADIADMDKMGGNTGITGGAATECRDQVIYALGYTRSDCCDKDDLASMPEYSGEDSSKLDFVKGMMEASEEAAEDLYEEPI